MEALGWWLMLVGSLRLASVWFGFFDIWALRMAVFSKTEIYFPVRVSIIGGTHMNGRITKFGCMAMWIVTPARYALNETSGVTDVHGRTFGVWTLLTCTLCFLCAFNLENRPLYAATFLSFIYAFGHFLTEYLFYHTMAASNLTTVGIFAGTSIVWMLLQWNAHQPKDTKKSD